MFVYSIFLLFKIYLYTSNGRYQNQKCPPTPSQHLKITHDIVTSFISVYSMYRPERQHFFKPIRYEYSLLLYCQAILFSTWLKCHTRLYRSLDFLFRTANDDKWLYHDSTVKFVSDKSSFNLMLVICWYYHSNATLLYFISHPLNIQTKFDENFEVSDDEIN